MELNTSGLNKQVIHFIESQRKLYADTPWGMQSIPMVIECLTFMSRDLKP